MITRLLVCNTAWGIANFRANVIRHWVGQGVRVVAIAPEDAAAQARLAELGAEFLPLALDNRGANPLKDMTVVWQLWRYYRQLRPQLVVHYTIKPVIYGSWAAALARVPSLAVVTGQGYAFLNAGLKALVARNLYRFSLRFARGVWFLNRDDFTLFTGQGLAPAAISDLLPGEGVDTAHFAPRPNPHADGRLRLLLVARLLYDKGIGEFAEVGNRLKHEQADAQDHHAADPRRGAGPAAGKPAEVELQLLGPFYPQNPQAIDPQTLAHWQAEGWLTYLGETSDVRDYLAQCDALVLPSYGEGLPRTVLEAMSMGKPVIATDVTGCRDLVVDGVTGVLCAARSSEALAQAVQRFAALSPAERLAMGQAGRARVEAQFADAAVLAHYDAFCRDLSAG